MKMINRETHERGTRKFDSAPAAPAFGVRGLVRALRRRPVAVERRGAFILQPRPLDAALLGRLVAQAVKAVTSHRTPRLALSFASHFSI